MFSLRISRHVAILLCVLATLLSVHFLDILALAVRSTQSVPFRPATVNLPHKPWIGAVHQGNISRAKLSIHVFREDGLLEVDPNGSHPIFELIERAEAQWTAKLGRASSSLGEAVTEYTRRYKRLPPKGFDQWWHYVEAHDVQLPDEYDQIWNDLEPLWGISPVDLRSLLAQHEAHSETFALGKNATSDVMLLNDSFSDPSRWEQKHLLLGANALIDSLRDVQHHLPPFRVIFSPFDNPNLFSDYEIKKMAMDAAASQTYIDLDISTPATHSKWISGCAPSSPARQSKTNSSTSPAKSFIYDHRITMDPCNHPQILTNHGEFLSHEPDSLNMIIPQFSLCTTTLHHDIQVPAFHSWVEDILPRTDDPEWDDKFDERLLWRGRNTGIWHAPWTRWKDAQRARLVEFARQLNGSVEVLIPPPSRHEPVGRGVEIARRKINPAMLDIAFAGSPICPPDFCEELSRLFEWRKYQTARESGNFRYVLDVDGNAWSSRFKRLLTSNSLIFKTTIYPEWWLDRIEPWVHYIPVQVDLSDLYDTLVFFRGGMYGDGAREDLARKIASAGRTWSKSYWRKEDMTAYLFRLVLEYARVMSLDRDSMSYKRSI